MVILQATHWLLLVIISISFNGHGWNHVQTDQMLLRRQIVHFVIFNVNLKRGFYEDSEIPVVRINSWQ